MNHLNITIFLVVILIGSSIVSYIEIKKYYKSEAEMRRTNDMNVFHTPIFSDKGMIALVIALISGITLIMSYLQQVKVIFY